MKRRSSIFWVASLLVVLVGCAPVPAVVRQGAADLSAHDFAPGPVRLDGQWALWWNREVTADAGPGSPGYALGNLPGFWSDGVDAPYPSIGSATYLLKLVLPETGGPWALRLPDISSAWKLTVNGQPVAELGSATTNANRYVAMIRPRVVPLPEGSHLTLCLYVVNGSDREGGIRDSILVGPRDRLDRDQLLAVVGSAFSIGGLLVLAVFNLIVFLVQRRHSGNLWLALFSALVAVRSTVTGPRLIHDLLPWLTFDQSAQLVFVCLLGAVASFIFYLRHLFPDWWPSRVFVPFLLYTGAFALLLIPMRTRDYSNAFLNFYDPALLIIFFVITGVAVWATWKRHQDGPLVLTGILFLLAGAVNDLAYQFFPLPQGDMLDRFLFVFLIFNTFLLSRQLNRDYDLTQRQSRELRQLDRMKDDFLARVTHELRTPLHGMAGILDAFKMGDFGPLTDRQGYHLGLIDASSRRLLSMVSSILDFSHLKKHQLVAEARPIQLKETVDFLLPSFYSRLRPGVALVNRISAQVPAALGDEVKLEQVLHHLILNSLQHTEWGTIAVEAESRDQQVVLIVRDTGPGIPEEKLSQLFSPFHQAADLDTRASGGLGLGLAISRQLVQQMGGKLELESKVGTGTSALVWLPVCPPAKLEYFRAQRVDRMFHWEPEAAPEPLGPPPADEREPAAEGAATVLVVDDEPVNLLVLRTFLGKLGYRVLEATNGPEALTMVTQNVVDLMILDIMMPGMSGYEVCTRVRERFSPARLPVLLLTAKNAVEDLLQGFQVGASDFMTKPFQRDELKARMELHLRVSKAARTGVVTPHPGP